MRRSLLLLSMALMSLAAMAGDFLLPLEGRQQYAILISARGMEISGVCIILSDNDGHKGTVVNEFGVHALDFTLSPDRKKLKLHNVVGPANKWLVKRMLKRDLKVLLSAQDTGEYKGKRVVVMEDDGTLTLENRKYQLKYSLKALNDDDHETAQ